jgi:hypothetical protein
VVFHVGGGFKDHMCIGTSEAQCTHTHHQPLLLPLLLLPAYQGRVHHRHVEAGGRGRAEELCEGLEVQGPGHEAVVHNQGPTDDTHHPRGRLAVAHVGLARPHQHLAPRSLVLRCDVRGCKYVAEGQQLHAVAHRTAAAHRLHIHHLHTQGDTSPQTRINQQPTLLRYPLLYHRLIPGWGRRLRPCRPP